MFGIRTVTDEDIRTFQAHGFVCKLLATAKAAEDGVCAFIEPTLVASHDLEAAVPKNFNLITYYGEKIGRHSFFGQGAGRYPTAFNAVEDCLDILAGKHGFYTDACYQHGGGPPLLCPHRLPGRILTIRYGGTLGKRHRHRLRKRSGYAPLGPGAAEKRPHLLPGRHSLMDHLSRSRQNACCGFFLQITQIIHTFVP